MRREAEGRAVDDGDAFLLEEGGDEVLVGRDRLAAWRSSCRSCPHTTDRRRTRPSGRGQVRPFAWFSIETTRSRRCAEQLAQFFGMKSCVPFSASTAAHCEIDDGLVVDCDCSFAIALISSVGPPA